MSEPETKGITTDTQRHQKGEGHGERLPRSETTTTGHGSRQFYSLLERMAEIHDKKSQDYASNQSPYGNYHFAGMVSVLFSHSPEDAGFVGRLAEKIYRIANLERDHKIPLNEAIEDTEIDIAVITLLWISDRITRRSLRPGGRGEELYRSLQSQSLFLDDGDKINLIKHLESELGFPGRNDSGEGHSGPELDSDFTRVVNSMNRDQRVRAMNYLRNLLS